MRLHKDYYAYWEKLNKQSEAAYEEECPKYEQAQQQARKRQESSPTNTAADMRVPEELKLQFPMIPPDISKAKFIQHLINNEPCSSLLASTEEVKPLQAPDRMLQFFSSLPKEFTTEMALALGEKFEMAETHVHKALRKAVKKHRIKRLAYGMYRKIS